METIQINRVYNIFDLNQSGLQYKEYNLSIHDELLAEFKLNNPSFIIEGADGRCIPYTLNGENEFNYIIDIYYTI